KKNIVMRIFRADVRVKELNDSLCILGIHGPSARAAFKDLPALEKEYDHAKINLAGEEMMVIRTHRTGDLGFYCLVQATAAVKVWQRLAQSEGVQVFGPKVQESLTMEAGVPIYGIDYDSENLSLEVNLNKAVSNSKGCYLGQEPVARLFSRGHVAKRLVG